MEEVGILLPSRSTHHPTSQSTQSSNETSGCQSIGQVDLTHGFSPEDGGDFTIRSKDDAEFTVHSAILSIASPIFKDLMSVGSGERVVALTEDGQTIRLMLSFLHHRTIPPIDDFNMLGRALEVARKYEIEAMTAWLRTLFWFETSALHMRRDPLQAYDIASVYGFSDVVDACYRHCIRKLNLRDQATMNEFVTTRQDPQSALALVARLSTRQAVITETLINVHEYPMNLLSRAWGTTHLEPEKLVAALICDKCRPAYYDSYFAPVSWQSFWAHRALQVLLREPLDQSEHVFKIGFLCKPYDHDSDTTTFCEKCFEQIQLRQNAVWEDWAGQVQLTLGDRLGDEI